MKIFFKFIVLTGILFAGIVWGINTAEKGIQSIQGTASNVNQQNFKITRIEGENVDVAVLGNAKTENPVTRVGEGSSNWLSSLGNGLRNTLVSITRASYLWVVKQL